MNAKRRRKLLARRTDATAAAPPTDYGLVTWTLSVVTLVLCDLGAAAATLLSRWAPLAASASLLAGLLLFAALVLGVLQLLVLPLILKFRGAMVPAPILVAALVAALAPWAAIACRAMNVVP